MAWEERGSRGARVERIMMDRRTELDLATTETSSINNFKMPMCTLIIE